MTKRLYTTDEVHDLIRSLSEGYGIPMQTMTELLIKYAVTAEREHGVGVLYNGGGGRDGRV